MNLIAVCLHCLDMRDFHSYMRNTPFLDKLRAKSVFIPFGRAQGHHSVDSLNAEMTGVWTSRYTDSKLTSEGLIQPSYYHINKHKLPQTIIEYLKKQGYQIFTEIDQYRDWRIPETLFENYDSGTQAVKEGMANKWLRAEPERLHQFASPKRMHRNELLDLVRNCQSPFYAHFFIRETHRPWDQPVELRDLYGFDYDPRHTWPWDAYCARRAAIEKSDELAAIRREGLRRADSIVAEIFQATENVEDVAYVIYSNHGEMLDWFRYIIPYKEIDDSLPFWQNMIPMVSHGNFPYEVLYANMQMWIIPGVEPKVMEGVGRLIDFAPTMLELAGVSDYWMDGESMLPYFGEGAFPDRDRYAESSAGKGCLSMVRKDGYKFISTGMRSDSTTIEFDPKESEIPVKLLTIATQDGPLEHRLAVFDLKSDPYEFVNLANTQRGREVVDWAIMMHKLLKGKSRGRERLPLSRIMKVRIYDVKSSMAHGLRRDRHMG